MKFFLRLLTLTSIAIVIMLSLQLTIQAKNSHSSSPRSLPQPTPTPFTISRPIPEISAKSYIVKLRDGNDLAILNPEIEYAPASTTKMVTALVAMETFPLNQIITVKHASDEGVVIGLKPGATFTLENLLYALLLPSANDAAEVIASAHPQGRDGFVKAMNLFVQKIGVSAHFKNPTGLDAPGHQASARDLATIAEYGMKNPIFRRLVSTPKATIFDQTASESFVLENRNELLDNEPGVNGVKTGFTYDAGEVLVTSLHWEKQDYLIVVMGSQDRFADTLKLIKWIKNEPIPTSSEITISPTP